MRGPTSLLGLYLDYYSYRISSNQSPEKKVEYLLAILRLK